jgi:hypothetical protein
MSATVASLKFVMGADTAEFERAMKGVEGAMKRAAAVGSAVGVTIANSLQGAFASMNKAVKDALTHADEMGKAAQKIGIAVEELSRLRHAAELSGVSFESLQTAMGRFSRNLMEAASNASSGAGRAFAALGVAATTAAGQIRPTTDVIADIAARFAGMQDGAGKTAIAMALFGKSGADLIPMLNQGRDGIRALMQEAEALGIVISTRTAQASERFNDNLDRIHKISTGLALKMTAELLPALELLAEKFLGFARSGDSVKAMADGLNAVIGFVAKNVASLSALIQGLTSFITDLGRAFQAGMPWSEAFRNVMAQNAAAAQAQVAALRQMFTEIDNATGAWRAHVEVAATVPQITAPIVAAANAGREAFRQFKDGWLADLDAILASNTTGAAEKIHEINRALQAGIVNQQKYGQMVRKVEEENRNNIASTGTLLASTLTTAFAKNKTAGIAAAIINTAVGITKAFSSLPPPFSFAQAALIAASGAAQIAAIKSTTPSGGGGNAPSVHGAGGGSAAAEAAPAAAAESRQAVTIDLKGGLFSADQVRELVGQLNEYTSDGGVLISTSTR